MIEIPGYDAWKTANPYEGPVRCDHCEEQFSDDDIVLVKAGQFCKDCVPCETCGENVGEAELDGANDCKECAQSKAEDAYDAEHSSGGVA
jgi:uncharacterized CHY-type Zn-finger protein